MSSTNIQGPTPDYPVGPRDTLTKEELVGEQLTNEEVEAACEYLDQLHIIEHNCEDLYYAARQFTESLSKALSGCDVDTGITLGQLETIPLIMVIQDIHLDLYNKGLRDKP